MSWQDEDPPPHAPIDEPPEYRPRKRDDIVFEKPLPSNVEVERLVLGLVLLNAESHLPEVQASIKPEDFTLDAHKRIYAAILDMHEKGEMRVERITLAEELMQRGELEAVGGLPALIDLDSGLPELPSLESYIKILKDKSVLRRLIFTSQAVIERCFSGQVEPVEALTSAEQNIREIHTSYGRRENGTSPRQIIEDFGSIGSFLDPSQRKRGLPTGYNKIDEMTTGMHEGELWVLGGATSQGKSALALNITQNVVLSEAPIPVSYFSLEMGGVSLMDRLMCSVAEVDSHKFRTGFLNQEERQKLQKAVFKLMDAPLKIYDRGDLSPEKIIESIRRDVDDGTKLIVLDYLQLLGRDKTSRASDNRNNEIASITRRFKMLLQDCGIPGILLSQVSRSVDRRSGTDGRPNLSDLRDSGAIAEDSNVVMFVYREEYYKRDREDLKGIAEAIIAKSRNGPVGTVKLRFRGSILRFENRADDIPPDEEPSGRAPYAD